MHSWPLSKNGRWARVSWSSSKATMTRTDPGEVELNASASLAISADAREVLVAAAADQYGGVMVLRHMAGTTIQVGDQTFGVSENRRSMAQWEAAITELHDRGLITDLNGKGESFQINDAGYRLVEDAI